MPFLRVSSEGREQIRDEGADADEGLDYLFWSTKYYTVDRLRKTGIVDLVRLYLDIHYRSVRRVKDQRA